MESFSAVLQILLAWLNFSRKPVVPACFSCQGFSNRLSPLWSRTLGGCRSPVPGQAGQTPMDAGDTLGSEMPAGVRTGLSFWFLLLNTEKNEKL